jgi:hypothetical protein
MLKKMIILSLASRATAAARVRYGYRPQPAFVNLVANQKRHGSHHSSLQFLHHGRRKQKFAYKRYLAKLRDETPDAEMDALHDNIIVATDEDNDSAAMKNTRTRFRARVSYCGTPFYGWQLQPGKPTVQVRLHQYLNCLSSILVHRVKTECTSLYRVK